MTATANRIAVAGYARAHDLAGLSDMLRKLNDASAESGWHAPALMLSTGEGEEEIVVGVRWISMVGGTGYYAAEIR